jgi:hypothetical protein
MAEEGENTCAAIYMDRIQHNHNCRTAEDA